MFRRKGGAENTVDISSVLGGVAHLVERYIRIVEVVSSSLIVSTKNIRVPTVHGYFYSEETRKGRFCGAKFKASGGRFESPRACRPRQQVGRVSSSPPTTYLFEPTDRLKIIQVSWMIFFLCPKTSSNILKRKDGA